VVLGSAACAAPNPGTPGTPGQGGAAATRVVIPSLRLDRPVVRGGQSVIDRGEVTLFDDGPGGWRDPVGPGEPGTYWLAAHRTSAGGPFIDLPALALGDIVELRTAGTTYRYQVVQRVVVGEWVAPDAVYGNDASSRRLVLQTCTSATERLLVTAVLV
jgi:LPXTG-site transpeptidase (sortase) family protein